MADVGDRTADSVIWFPGESTGKDEKGESAAIPVENNRVGSGTADPTGAPAGAPIYVKTTNNKIWVHNGTSWVPASGYNT